MDTTLLRRAERALGRPGGNASSLLVVRHGLLVLERYFNGHGRSTRVPVHSVTKSVSSVLVGVARKRNAYPALTARLGEVLPAQTFSGADAAAKKRIAVRDVLSMTDGIHWQDRTDFFEWMRSRDPNRTYLSRRLVVTPGRRFNYSSPAAHLALSLVARNLRVHAATIAARDLFRPIGIRRNEWHWPRLPDGSANGGFDLQLTPRALARLGLLYLRGGRWRGRQIVPREWVRVSTRMQSAGDAVEDAAYGYLWWVTRVRGMKAFFAAGLGGQYLYVVPERDLLVVTTNDIRLGLERHRDVIERLIVRAAR